MLTVHNLCKRTVCELQPFVSLLFPKTAISVDIFYVNILLPHFSSGNCLSLQAKDVFALINIK